MILLDFFYGNIVTATSNIRNLFNLGRKTRKNLFNLERTVPDSLSHFNPIGQSWSRGLSAARQAGKGEHKVAMTMA